MSPFRHGDHGSHDSTGGHGNPAHAPMRDPVAGTALVVDINSWLEWGTSQVRNLIRGPLTATLVVQADGVPKTTVQHSESVARGDSHIISRWPGQGDTVPVLIDRADPSRIRFLWDQMPTEQDKIDRMQAAQAQRLLKQAYSQPPPKPHRPLP